MIFPVRREMADVSLIGLPGYVVTPAEIIHAAMGYKHPHLDRTPPTFPFLPSTSLRSLFTVELIFDCFFIRSIGITLFDRVTTCIFPLGGFQKFNPTQSTTFQQSFQAFSFITNAFLQWFSSHLSLAPPSLQESRLPFPAPIVQAAMKSLFLPQMASFCLTPRSCLREFPVILRE